MLVVDMTYTNGNENYVCFRRNGEYWWWRTRYGNTIQLESCRFGYRAEYVNYLTHMQCRYADQCTFYTDLEELKHHAT